MREPDGRTKQVTLQVNEACDSRCRMCDFWQKESPLSMSWETIQRVVLPVLQDLAPLENVCLTGGEPTLHPDIADIARVVRPLTESLTIITSTSGLAGCFEQLADTVTGVMISIDGADAATYRRTRGVDLFDQALAWMRRIADAGTHQVSASCVIQRDNHDQLARLVELCLANGAQEVFLRVPSLTEDAFGRDSAVPRRTDVAAHLDEEEVERVSAQLVEIASSYPREQIPNVLQYARFVRSLAGREPRPGLTCDVPFTSMVIDPSGHYLPCFYLPFRSDLRDLSATAELQSSVCREVRDDADFRRRHCDGCHQYVDRKWAADDALTWIAPTIPVGAPS